MGNKLYVGSLSYQVTDQTLQELFAQHGTVTSAKVITDRFTGQSRGFGFVEMARISRLNGDCRCSNAVASCDTREIAPP